MIETNIDTFIETHCVQLLSGSVIETYLPANRQTRSWAARVREALSLFLVLDASTSQYNDEENVKKPDAEATR